MSSTAPMDAREHGEVAAIRHALAAGWLSADAVREAARSDDEDLLARLTASLPEGALGELRRVALDAEQAAARRGLPPGRPVGPGRTQRVVEGSLAPAAPAPAASPWDDVPTREHDEVVPIPRRPERRTADHVGVLTLPGDRGVITLPGAQPAPSAPSLAGPPPSSGTPAARSRYGPYEVVAELARGGMGVVHRARHHALGTEVALKVLLAGGAEAAEDRLRFEQEARTTAALVHPGIVAVRDYGVEGGAPWLAMDLVRGESLRALVAREGPLEPRRAARLVASVARAVAHAHEQGVLHRDLKPHNVLLDEAGAARLTDFGLARRVDVTGAGLTVTGQILGTPAYMPPEQAGAAGAVEPRSDVYGLGATLYELLTGRPPFQGVTVLHVLTAVLGTEPLPPSKLRPGLDRDLETIVLCCLEKEPARRYASAAALADDLERFVEGLPVQARPLTPVRRALRWSWRRRRAMAWTAVGACVALALLAGRARERARGGLREAEAAVAAIRSVVPPVDGRHRALELGMIAYREHLGDPRYAPLLVQAARVQAASQELGPACRTLDAVIGATPGDLAARALRARVRHQSGRAGARDDLQHVLGSGTCPPDALHDVVILLDALGRASEAQAVASVTLAAHPDAAAAHRGVAEATLAAGDPVAALPHARRAAELEPSRESLLALSAVTYEAGDRDAALATIDALLARQPDDLSARRLRASYRSELRQHEGAIEDATACIEGDHRRTEMLWVRMASARVLGQDERVVDDLRTLLEQEPAGRTAALLTQALLELGRVEEARAACARAEALEPDDPTVLNAVVSVAIEARDEVALERVVRRLEQVAPAHPLIPRARAALHLLRGDPGAALRDAEAAVRSDPGQSIALYFLGLSRVKLGDVRGGIAALESARAIQPENRMFLESLSQAYLLHGDRAAARPILAGLLARPGAAARVWNLQGMLSGQDEEPAKALEAFEEAVKRDPGFVPAHVNRAAARVELALRTNDPADWRAAATAAEAARALAPEHVGALAVLGHARLALGELDAAARALDQALTLDGADPVARCLRAELRLRRGDRAGAAADAAAVDERRLPGGLRPRLARLREALRAPPP